MKEKILQKLKEIENSKNVEILFAVGDLRKSVKLLAKSNASLRWKKFLKN